jgi:hypothetical protein
MKESIMVRTAAGLLVGVFLLAAGLAAANEGTQSLEEHAIATATTAADHAALAEHYRSEAADARVAAARHQSMGRAYGQGKQGTRGASFHCNKLHDQYSAMATEYEELAKLHEAEAKKSQ